MTPERYRQTILRDIWETIKAWDDDGPRTSEDIVEAGAVMMSNDHMGGKPYNIGVLKP